VRIVSLASSSSFASSASSFSSSPPPPPPPPDPSESFPPESFPSSPPSVLVGSAGEDASVSFSPEGSFSVSEDGVAPAAFGAATTPRAREGPRAPKVDGTLTLEGTRAFPEDDARVSGLERQSTARLASVDRARSRLRPRAVVALRPGAIAITSRDDLTRAAAPATGAAIEAAIALDMVLAAIEPKRVSTPRGDECSPGGGGSGGKSDIKRLPAHTSRHDAIVRAKFALKPVKAVEFDRR
jgi:hypothetical protein